ncbi:hypothetical protein GOP47_0023071 [Adiantum capillus-veneris]|uniref:Uncharacterized protein n=1 Tax=Adiantum capillus-veneris TaxID=13818 RepID=A0A9D4U7P5_ADICA|nr:hypothetical protein GOP47_0023071 [Adiantum capillus-veneris]
MLGIPLPGGYMQRYEIPPLPRKKSGQSGGKIKLDEHVSEVAASGYKRRHEDRHAETSRSHGEGNDNRRLDERYECREPYEDRNRRQRQHEHHGRREYEEGDSGRRSHHNDHHRKRETYRNEDDRKQHYHERREDSHGARQHKRSRHTGADRTLSDSHSSETDKGGKARKAHRRPDHERYESREPNVDDRWEP